TRACGVHRADGDRSVLQSNHLRARRPHPRRRRLPSHAGDTGGSIPVFGTRGSGREFQKMICLKMEQELLPARPAKCRLREPRNVSSVNMCQSPARWDHAEKEEYDAMRMQEIDIHDYARQLLDAHGDRAIVE